MSRRAVFDAIAAAKGAGASSHRGDDPAPTPTQMMRRYLDMRLVDARNETHGMILEVGPIGHMSRRTLLIEGVTRVTDITPQPRRDDRDAQHDDDLGDEIAERERYAERDIDTTPEPPEHHRRPW